MSPKKTSAPIVLLTDFGAKDHYVGVMKGVILSIHPDARMIDLSHEIQSFDVTGAYFQLLNSYSYFPAGSIFVAVVDPGVGSGRKIICAVTDRYTFLAPDNGILSFLAKQKKVRGMYEVTRSEYFLPSVSDTFHGRDIFAPVAARLSRGLSPKKLGPKLKSIALLDTPEPHVAAECIEGRIISVDKFGNLVTNIHKRLLPGRDMKARINDVTLHGLCRSYAAIKKGSCGLVIGGSDTVEIASRDGHAAEELSAKVGDRVRIEITA